MTDDDDESGAVGGMIGRGNRCIRRKPAPVSPCPPQIPYANQARTRAAAVAHRLLYATLHTSHKEHIRGFCTILRIKKAHSQHSIEQLLVSVTMQYNGVQLYNKFTPT
jgi:hypothetical protein